MAELPEEKKRKPNWTKEESLILTRLVKENQTILEGKFSPGITSVRRQETWKLITDSLNAVASHPRSKEEVEKKWKNLKMQGKRNYADFRYKTVATGGGPPPPPLSPVTQNVLDFFGRDNVALTGIGEGIDTTSLQMLPAISESESYSQLTPPPPPPSAATGTASSSTCMTEDQNSIGPSTILQIVSAPNVPNTGNDRRAALEEEKLELEIEYLKLKIIHMKEKIRKLEE